MLLSIPAVGRGRLEGLAEVLRRSHVRGVLAVSLPTRPRTLLARCSVSRFVTMLVLLVPIPLDACACWGTRWDGESRESSLGATTRSPVPALVRVSDWGIDLRSRTEGREGREERGREAMADAPFRVRSEKVTQDILVQVGLAPRPESSTPHAMHAGPTETLPYAHSSTGYEPGVGSVTRPPQFRHQARRNCNSRKDSIPPLMRQRHARM